jgi:pimeloyl-ACP methyl ester carboxylesterase
MSETVALQELAAGRRLTVGGIDTFVHEAGDGAAVLLIHGSGPGVSGWANWRLVLPALSERFHVVAHDQVGYNQTAPLPEGGRYGRKIWTEHALGLLDELGITRVHLVGNSMGGAIALSMAVARPELVDRIVLMGTMGLQMPIPPGLDELWGYAPSREAMKRAIELLAFDQRINTPELVELRYEASTRPGIDEAWQQMFPAPRQRWVDDLALSDPELRSVANPVLLVHGFNDQVIPFRATSLALMEILSDVRMHVFGHTGHWVQIERNDEFNAVVAEFLAGGA